MSMTRKQDITHITTQCQVQIISQVKFHNNVSYFPTNLPTSSVQLLQYSNTIRHESNLCATIVIIKVPFQCINQNPGEQHNADEQINLNILCIPIQSQVITLAITIQHTLRTLDVGMFVGKYKTFLWNFT